MSHKRKNRKSDSEDDFVGDETDSSTSNQTPPPQPPLKRSRMANTSKQSNNVTNTSHNRSQTQPTSQSTSTTQPQSASHLQPQRHSTKSTNIISHWQSLLKLNYEGIVQKVCFEFFWKVFDIFFV
jgi:hypothetical protein